MLPNRKRPRSILVAAATSLVLTRHSAHAYSSTRFFVGPFPSSSALQYADSSRADHSAIVEYHGRQTELSSTAELSPLQNEDCSTYPPWLSRFFARQDLLKQQKQQQDGVNLDWLEYSLIRQHGLPANEANEIIESFRFIVQANLNMAQGLGEFLKLVLELNGEHDSSNSLLVSKDFLTACMIHYADCIALRESRRTCRSQSDQTQAGAGEFPMQQLLLEPAPSSLSCSDLRLDKILDLTSSLSHEQAFRIAKGAARLKRAELLVQTTNKDNRRHVPELELRNLLLTVMDDWRSLALRCIACLYRLDGIIKYQQESLDYDTTPEMVHTARDAMRIYAVLSERLGMHRLKAKMEEKAFMILYKRQYQAVSTLYHNSGLPMEKLSKHLLRSVTKALQADDALMGQLEDLQVTSRVKEPYSFWKKVLKKKSRTKTLPCAKASSSDNSIALRSAYEQSSSLAINDIHDGIALRVVLRARRWSENDSEESIRAREHLLCHYVQRLIRSKWPEHDSSRIKDYISFPKPNGYQSLHHTSLILANDIRFPFEVQVRSEEMHRFAEFGLAAHWDYKLGAPPIQRSLTTFASSRSARGIKTKVAGLLPPSLALASPTATLNKSPLTVASRPFRSQPSVVTIKNYDNNERYIEALTVAKKRVENEQVYVFVVESNSPTGQGRLVSLPAPSSMTDVIAAVVEDAPMVVKTTSLWRNGKLAQMSESVDNGDLIVLDFDVQRAPNPVS